MTIEQVVIWIVIGGIAGILADWLVGGLKAGLIGAFIGGWLFGVLHINAGTGFVGDVIQALVGAIVLLLLLRVLRRL